MRVVVTGVAGFIGMHTARRLLERGDEVVGVDNLSDYYDVSLKHSRLRELQRLAGFKFARFGLETPGKLAVLMDQEKPDAVIHLAAQAGVRYSLTNPQAYIDANIQAFLNVLEACRQHPVRHLVYASSSSVYGGNTAMPFSEKHSVDHPISLYAATKKSNELMAHTYSHLFDIPTTGLRFFTVYGPWGRPDMALFLFTKAISEGRPIDLFNHGQMLRDFTYIDDIVEGVIRVLDKPATPDPAFDPAHPDPCSSAAPYRMFNIGNAHPVPLTEYVEAIEEALGVKAVRNLLPIQPGDVPATAADTSALEHWVGFKPSTPVREGVKRFVDWYKRYSRTAETAAA